MSISPKITSSHRVIVVALLIAAFFCYLLLEPYTHILVLAFILSLIMYPVHQRIETKMPNWKNFASLFSCTLLTVIIVIPLLFVFSAIAQQGIIFSQNLYAWINHGGFAKMVNDPLIVNSFDFVNKHLPFAPITPETIGQKLTAAASQIGANVVGKSAAFLGNVTTFLLDFFLMLFVLFFLLRDYHKIIRTLRHVLPLSRSQEDRLLDEIESVSKSAIMGSFLTAIVQGLAGGIGMWIAGFPGLFWGTMMGFASFIPVVGTALIWLPACIYLFFTGDTTLAIFLAVWSIALVGSIDNLLRPMLMQGSSGMNTLMIFFSLLGGIHYFGLMGIIYGPLVFAITLVLFNIYENEFKEFLNHQDKS